jgi:hypothetical protein
MNGGSVYKVESSNFMTMTQYIFIYKSSTDGEAILNKF